MKKKGTGTMAIIKNEELDHEMRKRVEYLQKNNNCIILIECKWVLDDIARKLNIN